MRVVPYSLLKNSCPKESYRTSATSVSLEIISTSDIKETLERARHNVTGIARNLPAALTLVRISQPDLILVDIHLEHSPEDGIDIAQRVLTQQTIPIIYLTGHSE
ncbi:hypothetical protein GCM10027592_30590 [Spirosoma flavus]